MIVEATERDQNPVHPYRPGRSGQDGRSDSRIPDPAGKGVGRRPTLGVSQE